MEIFRPKIILPIFLVCGLFSPFIFFSSSLKSWQGSNPFLLVWQEITYPVEWVWHKTTSGVKDSVNTYFALSGAADENLLLKSKLLELEAKVQDYDEKVQENKRLREMLGFVEKSQRKLHVSEIISTNIQTVFKSMRITGGSIDGIRIGMPVVSSGGVVGRIIRAGLKYSDVQLVVDADFHLDVLLQRTRVRGVLSGGAHNSCELHLHKRADIKIGDTIITSGFVGGFPKGLPVGKIKKITIESDDVSQKVSIEPWVKYERLDEVVVLLNQDESMQKILETADQIWLQNSIKKVTGG